MKTYPQAFEQYYSRCDSYLATGMSHWIDARVKRIAYNAWRAGRAHEKRRQP